MNLITLHGSTTHGKHFLNTLEGLSRYKRLVTPIEGVCCTDR